MSKRSSQKIVEIIYNVGQILALTQNKQKPTLKTADSGCNLTDDRSHKMQYNDPVIGNFHINFVSMGVPQYRLSHNTCIYKVCHVTLSAINSESSPDYPPHGAYGTTRGIFMNWLSIFAPREEY